MLLQNARAVGNAGIVLGTGNRVLGSEAVAAGNQGVTNGSAVRARWKSCAASGRAAVAGGMGSGAVCGSRQCAGGGGNDARRLSCAWLEHETATQAPVPP